MSISSLKHLWLVLAFAPLSLPASAGSSLILVTNSAGDSVHVVDPATNKVVKEFPAARPPMALRRRPTARGSMSATRPRSRSTCSTATTGALHQEGAAEQPAEQHRGHQERRPHPGRHRARPRRVDVIDAKTLTRTKSILVKGRLHNIYVTPDGKHLITGSIPSKLLTVIDLEREVPVWELAFDLGVRPMTIEAGPDGSTKRIFVQLSDTNGFAVVDFAARKEVARIKLPVSKTEFETDAGRATSPSHGIGVSPDNKTLWVTSIPNNAVFAYSLTARSSMTSS